METIEPKEDKAPIIDNILSIIGYKNMDSKQKAAVNRIILIIFSVLIGYGMLGCSPVEEVLPLASTIEQTSIPSPIPTRKPTETPIATPTALPTPYFDLNNLSDEELLLKCGVNNEDIEHIIGYAVDIGGVYVVEYTVNNLKCLALTTCGDYGNRCVIGDWLTSASVTNNLFSVDQKTFSDITLAASNEKVFDNPPFDGEPISEKYEGTKIVVEKAFVISLLREYLESTGRSVPKTEYSQDIEGPKMIGNIVSIVGILRYFLTVAPQEEAKNHIEFNFSQYEVTPTPYTK